MYFLGYSISALRRYCALKFLHTLEINQTLLAHTPSKFAVTAVVYKIRVVIFGSMVWFSGSAN